MYGRKAEARPVQAFPDRLHASQAARELDLDEADIVACLLSLTNNEFHKSAASNDKPGTMLDVYHPKVSTHRLYLKIQIQKSVAGGTVVVVSLWPK